MNTIFTLLLCFVTLQVFCQWKQTNGPITNNLISDLLSKDSIVIASAPCGIYLTSNEGISWRPIDFNSFTTSEIFKDTIYLGGSQGIKKFFISGGRWQVTSVQVSGGLKELYTDNVNLYSASTYFGFRFSSDGKKWQSYNEGLPKIPHSMPGHSDVSYYTYDAFAVNGNDNYVFVGASDGLYRSLKSTLNWINISTGITFSLISAVYCQGSIVIISSANKVYKSENNGDTWQLIHTFGENTVINKIKGIDDAVFLLTDKEGLFISRDLGTTWIAQNNGLISQNVTCITKHKDNFYVGNTDGVYSNLSHWTKVDKNFICSSIYDLEKTETAIAAVDGKNIHISTDNGITWRNTTTSITMDVLYSVVNLNNAFFFSALPLHYFDDCTSYVSNDNGVSWVNHSSLANYGDPYSVRSNGSKVIAVTDDLIFLWNDTETAWKNISPPPGMVCNNFNAALITGNDIYIAGCGEGEVIKSPDNGINWTQSNDGLSRYEVINKLAECQGILFTCTASGLYKSIDKGKSWQKCGNGIPASTNTICDMVSDDQYIYLCTQTNVFASNDKGDNWSDISSGLPSLPKTKRGTLLTKDNYLFFGTNSYGVWKRAVSDIVLSAQGKTQKQELHVYPNPAKKTIYFTVPVNHSFEKAELLDLSGKLMVTSSLAENNINIQQLPKGIYLLRITTKNNELFYSKVIKTD